VQRQQQQQQQEQAVPTHAQTQCCTAVSKACSSHKPCLLHHFYVTISTIRDSRGGSAAGMLTKSRHHHKTVANGLDK
jgi:hypothetical protein